MVTTLSPVFCSGDNEAHSFIVKAMRNGKPVSLNGATVNGFFIRPDNVTITLKGSVNADGEAVVTLSDSCYDKQGRFQLFIRSEMNGVKSVIFCCVGRMLITSTDSFVDDGNIVSLDDLMDQIEAMQEATARANEAADRADPDTIVQMVLDELGASVIGKVYADNNIILTGDLADGTYTLKYENADGTVTNIGTVEVGGSEGGEDPGEDPDPGEEPDPIVPDTSNALATSVDVDGSAYNGGLGYKAGYRYSSSGGGDVAGSGLYVTGYIKCKDTDTLYFKNVGMNKDAGVSNGCNMYTFATLGGASTDTADASIMTNYQSAQWDASGNIVSVKVTNAPSGADVYVRFNTTYLGADSVIKINEPIA